MYLPWCKCNRTCLCLASVHWTWQWALTLLAAAEQPSHPADAWLAIQVRALQLATALGAATLAARQAFPARPKAEGAAAAPQALRQGHFEICALQLRWGRMGLGLGGVETKWDRSK